MPVVNVSDEAHAFAKQAASEERVTLADWVSRRITDGPLEVLPPSLERVAKERGETPGITLEKALEALNRPVGVVPLVRKEGMHADGMPICKCDGESGYGPHHKKECHRRVG